MNYEYDHFSKLDEKIYFGCYIYDNILFELESLGIKLIVDLTNEKEKEDYNLPLCATNIEIINFPIIDRGISDETDTK